MSNGILMGNAIGVYGFPVTLTPAIVATISSPEQSFTVPGVSLATDMIVGIEPPSNVNGVAVVYGRITADNTVAIKFVNPTAGGVTPAAGQYTFSVLRFSPATSLSD
jgi:hypothetical protein